ncbi:MAG: hypothetical protein MUE51_00525 [Thermoleophilia bacterium]|nr:hypothetical protein [Thermoleophilia bacterium]
MGLRKKYTVVVVGVEGSATAQRSELGRFRSEDAARTAAREEWRRLMFVHAPHADRYRVVIERDGTEIADVDPPGPPPAEPPPGLDAPVSETGSHPVVAPADGEAAPAGEPAADGPSADPQADDADGGAADQADAPSGPVTAEHPSGLEAAAGEGEGEGGEGGEAPAEGGPEGPGGAGDEGEGAPGLETTGTNPIIAAEEEPVPEGPVPEEIIERFAEAVRREEERAARRRERE